MGQQRLARIGAFLLLLLIGASGQGPTGHSYRSKMMSRWIQTDEDRFNMCINSAAGPVMLNEDKPNSKLNKCVKADGSNIITCSPYCHGESSSMDIYPVYTRTCSNVSRVDVTLTPIRHGYTSGSEAAETSHMLNSTRDCSEWTFISAELNMAMVLSNCDDETYSFSIDKYDDNGDVVACNDLEYRFYSRIYDVSK